MNFECGFLGNPMEGVEHLTLTNLPCGLGKKKKSKQNEKKKSTATIKKKLVRTLRLRILMYF